MKENYQSLYEEYEDDRSLSKLKNYALWTIPGAFPDVNKDTQMKGNIAIEQDYQSIGASLVNFLSSKLAGLLFPVTQSFFKIQPTDKLRALASNVMGVEETEVNNTLVNLENAACKVLYKNASYSQLIQMMRYLIITGNALFKRVNGKFTVYSLRNYAQLRDNEGTVLDIVLREDWAYSSLPDDVRKVIRQPQGTKDSEPVTVYTRIKREVVNGNVIQVVSQQIDGVDIGKPSKYPEHLCPYHSVVWNLVNGDSNGRGLVEDHAGDFARLSDLSRALAVYEVQSCKVINVVKPGGSLDVDQMEEAASGDYVQGDPDNVRAHESGDYAKIQQLNATIQSISQRLSVAFMYQGNTRDAERVTAEEIQRNAQEAESALGGVYSQLSQGIHLPLSYILTYEVDPKFMTAVIAGEVELEVITGLPALGRSTVVTQLIQASQEVAVVVPALTQMTARFDAEATIDLILQARGINLKDIMLSKEALEAKQKAQVQAQAAQNAQMQGIDPNAQVQAAQGIM